jgi:hypothetical protein
VKCSMVRMVPDAIMVDSMMLSTTIANDTDCSNVNMAQPEIRTGQARREVEGLEVSGCEFEASSRAQLLGSQTAKITCDQNFRILIASPTPTERREGLCRPIFIG